MTDMVDTEAHVVAVIGSTENGSDLVVATAAASAPARVSPNRSYTGVKDVVTVRPYSPERERNDGHALKYEDDTADRFMHDDATRPSGEVQDRNDLSPASENSVASYEWSFEEQFKQLYELDAETGRKTFLDDYFDFMKRRGTPVSRIPIMAKQILDLYQLYNLVVRHGGLVQVIRNKQWSKVTKGLHLPTSITSAAFTLRTQYLKYLYPYECAMHSLSTPKELQAAIDSNRRDRFSTLYHPEASMTSQRDDRFAPFPMNGYDFAGVPPSALHPSPVHHHHHQIPAQVIKNEMKYPMKRSIDSMIGRGYDKFGAENPKVIILQDGQHMPGDGYAPEKQVAHVAMKSPVDHEVETRKINELELMRQRVHHMMYNGKDWDGDIRHVIEEEQRYNYQHAHRAPDSRMLCKDKGCNGVDCKYPYADNRDMRRHHSGNHVTTPVCACSYCTGRPAQRYPSPNGRRACESEDFRHQSEAPVKQRLHRLDSSGSGERSPLSPNSKLHNGNEPTGDVRSPSISTHKERGPETGRGASSEQGIFVSMEIAGKMYEGYVHQKHSEQHTRK